MANTTDYSRLLDGYTLLAIKGWVEGLLSYKAPLASPTFTGTVTLPTSVKIGTSTATGLVKYTNGTLSIDTSSYKTDYRYRPIQVAGTEKITTTASTALNFLNGTHSVQFTYNSGLYAEVNLKNYKPDNTNSFLDASNKVRTMYLPDTVLGQLQYVGTWNATSPSWPSGRTKLRGEYWICSTAGGKWPDGTTATGKSFVVGDWAIWTGAGTEADPYRWEKVDNTDAISSITLVNGDALTGPVTIPLAASNAYGLIKVGYSASGKNYAVQLDSSGKAYVNVPWTDTVAGLYVGITYGIGDEIALLHFWNGDSSTESQFSIKVPYATASQYGLVKPGAVRSSAITATTGGTTSGRYYGVELDSNGKMFVNVPWTDHYAWSDITGKPNFASVATSGSYNDLSNKPTIPATNVIPSVSTANKVLLSTSTGGTAAWSAWSSAGFLKTNASGVVSVDTTSYIPVGGSSAITGDLIPSTAGSSSAGVSLGSSSKPWKYVYAYEMTATSFTAKGSNTYAIYGDRAIALGTTGSPTAILTLPTTTGTLALVGDNNHTHTLSIATDSGTNQLTLAFGTKYKLTAGGSTYIFTMPTNPNTNYYPTTFAWTNGTTNGPTGSLTGVGMSAVSFGAIPAASASYSGIVTTGTQSFSGQKSFLSGIVSQDSSIQDLKIAIMPSYITFLDGNGYTTLTNSNTAGGKYVNINTYSQTEAENILKGLNSDGTSI